jgi:hypothetical protein
MTWNCNGGVQLTAVDENNQTTTTTFNDPYFWRPASVTDQSGAIPHLLGCGAFFNRTEGNTPPAADFLACEFSCPQQAVQVVQANSERSCCLDYELLQGRHESLDHPSEGWIFPSSSERGHFNGDAAKDQHKKALTDSGVKAFVPYTLRHTALTNLGEKAGGDVFVLARIAGHSSITVTQRYIHPQADAINRVFAASQSPVGTKLGTTKGKQKLERSRRS